MLTTNDYAFATFCDTIRAGWEPKPSMHVVTTPMNVLDAAMQLYTSFILVHMARGLRVEEAFLLELPSLLTILPPMPALSQQISESPAGQVMLARMAAQLIDARRTHDSPEAKAKRHQDYKHGVRRPPDRKPALAAEVRYARMVAPFLN